MGLTREEKRRRTLREIVEREGGPTAFGTTINRTHGSVIGWIREGRIPPLAMRQVRAMRPDLVAELEPLTLGDR